MGALLLIIASLLKWILAPVAYTIGTIVSLCKRENDHYNKQLAVVKDEYGNILCKYIFNFLLIKKHGYKFGATNETISSVIGKNKLDESLTFIGVFIDKILDSIEPNHSIKSINEKIT